MSLVLSLTLLSFKCVKLAWSLGFDLFRARRDPRARVTVRVGLGLG